MARPVVWHFERNVWVENRNYSQRSVTIIIMTILDRSKDTVRLIFDESLLVACWPRKGVPFGIHINHLVLFFSPFWSTITVGRPHKQRHWLQNVTSVSVSPWQSYWEKILGIIERTDCSERNAFGHHHHHMWITKYVCDDLPQRLSQMCRDQGAKAMQATTWREMIFYVPM